MPQEQLANEVLAREEAPLCYAQGGFSGFWSVSQTPFHFDLATGLTHTFSEVPEFLQE